MPLHPRVAAVTVIRNFLLRIEFRDGTAGTLDLARLVKSSGGVFEPLHDPSAFAAVRIDHEAGTIVWPNGADIDPDVLYEMVLRSAREDSHAGELTPKG
jgi:hypothetical protein